MLPTSPKKAGLLHNSRYALQTFPPPGLDYLKEGEEFYITGETRPVLDLAVRRSVISDARQHIGEDEMLFELKIRAVMHTAWQPGPGGALQPFRRKWHAAVAPKDTRGPVG